MRVPGTPDQTFLYDASTFLEDLGHSPALDTMLQDHTLERKTFASAAGLLVEADWIPEEVRDHHFLPPIFETTAFEARLKESSDGNWHLDATYTIDETRYDVTAGEEKTDIKSMGLAGSEVIYSYPGVTAAYLLGALTLGALKQNESGVPPVLQDSETSWPRKIDRLLYIIGNCSGEFRSQITGLFPDRERDRAVMITRIEKETPTVSGINVLYHLVWGLGDASEMVVTDMVSQQGEAIIHMSPGVGNLFVNGPEQHTKRAAERKGAAVLPEDIVLSEVLEGSSQPIQFVPQENLQEYARVNTAIVASLRPYLRQYRQLDSSIDELEQSIAKRL